MEPIDEYLRSCLSVESASESGLAATILVPEDLQGPPGVAHGGAVAMFAYEMARALDRERPGDARGEALAGAFALDVSLSRALPVGARLAGRATRAAPAARDGDRDRARVCARIERPDGTVIAEAAVGAAARPRAGSFDLRDGSSDSRDESSDALRRLWEARDEPPSEVPGTAMCLVCGQRNARGLRARLHYDRALVWKRLTPPASFRQSDGALFPGFAFATLDEIGWWLGALAAGECGLSTRLSFAVRGPIPHGEPLLLVGERARSVTDDPRRRVWRSRAALVAESWRTVATAEVTFAASRAFTRSMAAGLFNASDREAVRRLFPNTLHEAS